MHINNIVSEGEEWIQLALEGIHWRSLAEAVMNFEYRTPTEFSLVSLEAPECPPQTTRNIFLSEKLPSNHGELTSRVVLSLRCSVSQTVVRVPVGVSKQQARGTTVPNL
jgi:hypothetical protein